MSCFKTTILGLRCIGYSILALFALFFIYIRNIGSKPWKPKDRPNPPEYLTHPKYGVHKFASVNVSFDITAFLKSILFRHQVALFQNNKRTKLFLSPRCVQGIRLHYVEAGDSSKPLMLFVHGFPEFWYCWRHQITEFSKDFW